MSYWYLATPYALYAGGKEAAYEEARELSAVLMSKGIVVYSPIVHNHPISCRFEIKGKEDHFIWWVKTVDQAMMRGSCGLIVATIDGWQESRGVRWEIDWYKSHNLPIVYWSVEQEISLPEVEHFSSLSVVQDELKPWQQHNFPNRPAWQPLVGMQEELGELSLAFLKKSQNIRLTEDHDANMRDALADLLVYACDFANAVGINLSEELSITWAKVRQRDWQKHRENHSLSL